MRAGCDVVLQCSGNLPAMVKVASGIKPLTGKSLKRAQIADIMSIPCDDFDAASSALVEYEGLVNVATGKTLMSATGEW